MEKGKKLYVADLETSAIDETRTSAFAYACGLMDVDDNQNKLVYYNDIEDFITYLFNLPTSVSTIYFHNLSFDIEFLLNYLVNNKGFTQLIPSKSEDNKKIQAKSDEKTFDSILANGTYYQVTLNVKYDHYKTPKGRTSKKTVMRKIIFKDTFKICAFPLKKIVKDFLGIDIPKDGIDHNIIRPKYYVLNDEEYKYLYEDVKYLKDFVQLMFIEGIEVNKDFRVIFDKLTIASQSLDVYKKMMVEEYFNLNDNLLKLLVGCNPIDLSKAREKIGRIKLTESKENIIKKNKNLIFQTLYPPLHHNIDSFIRKSYYGGIVYKNPYLANQPKEKLHGLVFDVNSLYPSVMRTRLLPYSTPIHYEGNYKDSNIDKETYPLYVQSIKVKRFKIKDGFIPNIQIRGIKHFNGTEYQESNIYKDEQGEENYLDCYFTFTNVQLERFLKSYDVIGITYLEGYAFKGAYGLFDKYIDTFMELKKVGKGARRQTAKLFLNSLYGKFGTNPRREFKIIKYEDETFSTTTINEDGETLEFLEDGVYIPMATFITSYAREVLLSAIEKVHDRFLYCDTDSIHVLGYEVPDIPIDDKELGKWAHEGTFSQAKYIGAKRYAEMIDGKWDIKCCGLSRDIMSKLDDIEVFDNCKFSTKEVNKMKESFYTKKDDIYYYEDKECTKRVVGLVRSKKKKYVKGGILINEQPYKINDIVLLYN